MTDDTPHTLLSLPCDIQRTNSHAIPISGKNPTPTFPCSSGSYLSNHLQISQSPTVPFMTQRGNISQHLGSIDLPTHKVYSFTEPVSGNCPSLHSEKNTIHSVCVQDIDQTIPSQCLLIDPKLNKERYKEHTSELHCVYTQIPQHSSKSLKVDPNSSFSPNIPPESFLTHNITPKTLSLTEPYRIPPPQPHNVPSPQLPNSTTSVNTPTSSPPTVEPLHTMSSPQTLNSSQRFYNFVILHVREDIDAARRLCSLLEEHGVGEGTTFCEGFECPGISPLTCIQDAVENCAYIILLLTKYFETRWAEFQSNTVLMNSITAVDKFGSVIPFLPLSDPMTISKMPMALKSLVLLDENSPVFYKVVRNTFRQDIILREKKRWFDQLRLKTKKQEQEMLSEQMRLVLQLKEYSEKNPIKQLLAQFCPELNQNQFFGSYPPTAVDTAGSQQIIQINHAENVQIGNQNCMKIQQAASELRGINADDWNCHGEEARGFHEGEERRDEDEDVNQTE